MEKPSEQQMPPAQCPCWPAPWCGPALCTGGPSQTPLLPALEVQDGGRTKATLRRGRRVPESRLGMAQLLTVSFRLFKTTSPRGEPQDGLYCIRNSSTKSGKVGTAEGALAATLPSSGPRGTAVLLGSPHARLMGAYGT